jgi:hypothetical protein
LSGFQQFVNEWIVIDNCSSDGTPEIAARPPMWPMQLFFSMVTAVTGLLKLIHGPGSVCTISFKCLNVSEGSGRIV